MDDEFFKEIHHAILQQRKEEKLTTYIFIGITLAAAGIFLFSVAGLIVMLGFVI